MSNMSELDILLREAGINPDFLDTVDPDETDALNTLDAECQDCECPDIGVRYYKWRNDWDDCEIDICSHPCRLLADDMLVDSIHSQEEIDS